MKKSILISFIMLSVIVAPLQTYAGTDKTEKKISFINKAEGEDQATLLLARLDEINNMDKSSLDRAKKREMRKEVRSIKKELNENHGGVYLSVGAVILIVVLLIILL